MKATLLLVSSTLLAAVDTTAQPRLGAPPAPDYELLFADEFDGIYNRALPAEEIASLSAK